MSVRATFGQPLDTTKAKRSSAWPCLDWWGYQDLNLGPLHYQ